MEHADASEPEDGEILDENEGELARSEEEGVEGAYGHYGGRNRDKRTSRNSRPAKGYARSRMERFVKHTEAYKQLVRRRVNPRKNPHQPTKPYNRTHSRGSPHEGYPYYGGHRSNDRSRGSVSPANHLGGSTSQGRINLLRYSFRGFRKPKARDMSEILGNDGCGPCSPSRLEIRRKRFQETNGSDYIRLAHSPIRPNGVNNQVLPGSSKGLMALDTARTEACSIAAAMLMPKGPAVRPVAINHTGNPDVEPVSDDEESISVIPERETATGKKSPLIITLSSTDTSEDEGESARREIHRQNIITDDNKVISIVAPVEHSGTSTVEQGHLEREQTEGAQDEVLESQAASCIASTSRAAIVAVNSPHENENNTIDDQEFAGMEVEIVEVIEEDSNSRADKIGDNSEGEDDIYELELRNQLLADLVEKTGNQESANPNDETSVQNLEGNQQEEDLEGETNTGVDDDDGNVPDEEESALREVLLSQMAIKRKQLTSTRILKTNVGMSSGANPVNDLVGILHSPGIATTTQEQRSCNLNISPGNTTRPPIVGPSSEPHTSTPNSRRGGLSARRGRNNRNRNRHKSDGNKYPLKSSQISPNLIFDAQQHRVIRIANEQPLRHPQPHVINRPANLKNLPDNDLRNKLLRNRRNEQQQQQQQQQQAQDTSIISLFPEFGVADTDMRRVDITPRIQDQISDMTIRRTVNFDPSPSASPTTNSSTAITYMAPINVEIPNESPSPIASPCLMRMQNEAAQFQHHSPFMQSTPPSGPVPIPLSPYMVSSPVSFDHHQGQLGSPVTYIPGQASPQGHGYIVQQGSQVRPEINCGPYGYPCPSRVPTPVYPSPQQVQMLPSTTIHGNPPGLIMSVPGYHNQISYDIDHRFRPQVGVPMYFVGNRMNDNRPEIVMSSHDATTSHSLILESNTLIQRGGPQGDSPGSRVGGLHTFHPSVTPTINAFVTISETQMTFTHSGETLNAGIIHQEHVTQQSEFDLQSYRQGRALMQLPVVTTTEMIHVSESAFVDSHARPEPMHGANLKNLTQIRTIASSSLSVARSSANVAVSSSGRNYPIVSIKEQQQTTPVKGEGPSLKGITGTSTTNSAGITPRKKPAVKSTSISDSSSAAPTKEAKDSCTGSPEANAPQKVATVENDTSPDLREKLSKRNLETNTSAGSSAAVPTKDATVVNTRKSVKSVTVQKKGTTSGSTTIVTVSEKLMTTETTSKRTTRSSTRAKLLEQESAAKQIASTITSQPIKKSTGPSATTPDANITIPKKNHAGKTTTRPNASANIQRKEDPTDKSTPSPDASATPSSKEVIAENSTSPDTSTKIPRKEDPIVKSTSTDASVTVSSKETTTNTTTSPDASAEAPNKESTIKNTTIPDASVIALNKESTVGITSSPDASVLASNKESAAKSTTSPDASGTTARKDPTVESSVSTDVSVLASNKESTTKNTTSPDASVAASSKEDPTDKNTPSHDSIGTASSKEAIVENSTSTDAGITVPTNEPSTKCKQSPAADLIVPTKDPMVKSTTSTDASGVVVGVTSVVASATVERNDTTTENARSPDACERTSSSNVTSQKPNSEPVPDVSAGGNLSTTTASALKNVKSSATSSGKSQLIANADLGKEVSDSQKQPHPGPHSTTKALVVAEVKPSPNKKGTPNIKPNSTSTIVPVAGMTTKSNAFAANIPKPKPKMKPVTPVVIPVTEGDTTEDEDDEKGESQDGGRKRRKYSFTGNATSSDPSNPMFHTYLDNFLKNCREKVDKLEKEKSQEVKKGQDTTSKGIMATDVSSQDGERRTGIQNKVLLEKLENAILGVGTSKTSNASDEIKGSTALQPGPATRPKNSPQKASSNMQVALLKEANADSRTMENEASKIQVLPRKRQGSPSIQLPQNKRRAISDDPSGTTTTIQISGPITAAPPVITATKAAIASSSSIPSNVQDTSANSKAVIESLTERVTETRNQIQLSLKEKELIQIRQHCYNEYKDILRDLQHHTRISNLNTRLDQDIVELEKKLAAQKKKKEAAQQKASDINKSIKEKSKKALTHKKSCLNLATDVKKLGDKIIGDKKYKVPDILVENINELMRSMRNMDTKQPENLQRERGVPFKQLIFDEGTFSSSLANLTVAVPSSSAGTSSQLQPQKTAQQKKKAMSSAAVENAININRSVSDNLQIVTGKEGKTEDLDSETSEASQNKEVMPEASQSEEETTEASQNEEELPVSMDTNDEVEPHFISSSKSLNAEDVTKGKRGASIFVERLPLREGDILNSQRPIRWKVPEYTFSPLQFFRKKGPEK